MQNRTKFSWFKQLGSNNSIDKLSSAFIERFNSCASMTLAIWLNPAPKEEFRLVIKDVLKHHNANYGANQIDFSKLDKQDVTYIATHFANQILAKLMGADVPNLTFVHDGFNIVNQVSFPDDLKYNCKKLIRGDIESAYHRYPSLVETVNSNLTSKIRDVVTQHSIAAMLDNAITHWQAAVVADKNVEQLGAPVDVVVKAPGNK